MYIKRILSSVIKNADSFSPVIMVTGPRQAGKTTLLRKLEPNREFVTLDDLELRSLAQNDPKTFIEQFPPPVLIDEFQYAPQILPYIKIYVDRLRTKGKKAAGLFWLTGSQHFSMMEGVQESLAGRVSILNLLGLSRKEIDKTPYKKQDFITAKLSKFKTNKTIKDIYNLIIRGSKPELWANKKIDREIYYRSYIQTYIERDVISQLKIRDTGQFMKFLNLLAGRIGQLLNFSSLSVELGVSSPTIKQWCTILQRTFQIYLLSPYYRNIGKRSLKTPKIYFLDTGLLCALLKINNSNELAKHYLNGNIFENWVIAEIIKTYWNGGTEARIYFWRTKDGTEIDIIYETGGVLFPLEIKMTASPKINLFHDFEAQLKDKSLQMGRKKIVCSSKINHSIDKNTDIISALSIE